MSVHTLTVLAGKKEFLSSVNLEDMLVPNDEPNLFSPTLSSLRGRDVQKSAPASMLISPPFTPMIERSQHIFYIWKEK